MNDAHRLDGHPVAAPAHSTLEGTFRQHMVVKGENRDTAWFSILDSEWPRCQAGFQRWLAPENFDEQGQQVARLEALRDGGR